MKRAAHLFRMFVCANAFLLSACATPLVNISAAPGAGSTAFFDRGRPGISTISGEIAVGVLSSSASPEVGQRLHFELAIINKSDAPITIGPENVAATLADGRAVAVIPPEQLEREARRAVAWQRFGAALRAAGASMDAANAGNSTMSGTYYGQAGGRPVTGAYTGTAYDPAAQAAAQNAANMQARSDAAQINEFERQRMAQAQATSFLRHTINPGEDYVTPLVVDKLPGGAQTLTISVNVAGEVYGFPFAIGAP
jgi:hypothetical protein